MFYYSNYEGSIHIDIIIYKIIKITYNYCTHINCISVVWLYSNKSGNNTLLTSADCNQLQQVQNVELHLLCSDTLVDS